MAGFMKHSFNPLAGTRFGPRAAPRALQAPRAAAAPMAAKAAPAAEPATATVAAPQPARRRKRGRRA